MGSHMSLGPEMWPFWGGWELFRRLGTGFVGYRTIGLSLLSLPLFLIRVRVTELKYVAL